jgi:hypothetical protein
MNRRTSAANPLIDPAQLHLNQLWQLTEARLLMETSTGTDLNSLHYVELRELDLARGWALLTVPNVGFQAQLQQAPLNPYVREALSSVCRRVLNLAVVVPTREGLPTLDEVLAQEAASPQ